LFGFVPSPGAPVIANGHLTAGTLIGHLLMIGEFDVEAINPPIWTLVHEARLSLLFPLIYQRRGISIICRKGLFPTPFGEPLISR
jgi:hypothetical protein